LSFGQKLAHLECFLFWVEMLSISLLFVTTRAGGGLLSGAQIFEFDSLLADLLQQVVSLCLGRRSICFFLLLGIASLDRVVQVDHFFVDQGL